MSGVQLLRTWSEVASQSLSQPLINGLLHIVHGAFKSFHPGGSLADPEVSHSALTSRNALGEDPTSIMGP
eukprot:6200841-Amphidinium_carterae.6